MSLDPVIAQMEKELDSFRLDPLENYKEDFEQMKNLMGDMLDLDTFTAADLMELDNLDFNSETDQFNSETDS